MYTKKLTPLSREDIKKVNATVLASTFNVSQSYVSRILKSDRMPNSKSGKKILIAARIILDTYDNIRQLMTSSEEINKDKIRILAEAYIKEGHIETTLVNSQIGNIDLNDILVNFYRYVDTWTRRN
jgi:transcriptional regulator with XRE-family HTH domain